MSRVLPILFNTDMVRAILDGRKTVTRRLIKPQPKSRLSYLFAGYGCGKWSYPSKCAAAIWGADYQLPDDLTDDEKEMLWTPPFHTDDILYVRETWNHYIYDDLLNGTHKEGYFYKASPEMKSELPDYVQCHFGEIWRPSIHMPKEAARIWLKVTGVRVERLQECGKGWCLDIEKEGIVTPQDPILYINDDAFHDALREGFQKLWDSTIKKSDLDRYGWDANPWVWVIEFERCEKPE